MSLSRLAIGACAALLAAGGYVHAQDSIATKARIRTVADAILKQGTFRFVDPKTGNVYHAPEQAPPDAELHLESPWNDWRYWNGVLNIGLIEAADVLGDSAYSGFARRNVAFSFDHAAYFERRYAGQVKWFYPFAQFFTMEDLDDYGAMCASVVEVCRWDPNDDYRAYLARAAGELLTRQTRGPDATFMRASPVRWTLWADDLYMSVAFLARMGSLTKDDRYFDEAAAQVVRFHARLFDNGKGLMSHCWYSDLGIPGVAFWGRANGWALLAQVDLLDRLPADHPGRDTLLALLREHLLGIARYQGADGLWHQLLDKDDSYLETSCSAMFTYAFARAVDRGYLPERYASIAQRGWEVVAAKVRTDGSIDGVCAGTFVGSDLAYYYSRPAPENDPHGAGALLLAGSEILRLDRRTH